MPSTAGAVTMSVLVAGFILALLAVTPLALARPDVHRFKWEVEYQFWSPDCQERPVMAINGRFPGPTIRAKAGDIVHVDLTNKLNTEGVVIHWHGIRQMGTPWADGTAAISQCAINPGESFAYRFVVDKPGTYFYHGHYGMQRSAGLYGALIVDVANGTSEPFHYDGEFDLLLSDWWHKSVHEQEIGLSSIPFRWINEPNSLLINGRGQYGCSLAAGTCKFNGTEQCAPRVLRVFPNKTYRLRIASTTALASLSVAVANHKMTVVEADGNYVQPFEVENLYIYSGESYSVLITTDQDPTKNYWISVGVVGREPNTTQALTLLNYVSVRAAVLPASPPPAAPRWNDYSSMRVFARKIHALPHYSYAPPPARVHRRIALLNTQNKYNSQTKWAINNVSLSLPTTPYLGSLRYNLREAFDATPPPEGFPFDYDIMVPASNTECTVNNGIYLLQLNTTIDVVLQNANTLSANTSEIHPWHLHGHDFWVLGYGDGKFVEGVSDRKFNLKNPPLRNTVVIFPYGWTVLRFVADNPGAWAFHCHIEPHLHMGMGVVLAEGVERVRGIPNEALKCGLTGKMFMDSKRG
ncbi:hypothetical protein SAY87_005440 [Trapa incisa]|uniref:L-ascorbate oxidase n=1 Tax=Trapa incisa TaxID=236973 RepID=A0AAN7Q6W2_9MYRT|nr:hypothetical protein SAY87_005440 [Trapa incisa]